MGNYPESSNCPVDKPFYVFCSHSLHNLEGWNGKCRKTETEAQQDAESHVQMEHNGNSRWTGVMKAKTSRY